MIAYIETEYDIDYVFDALFIVMFTLYVTGFHITVHYNYHNYLDYYIIGNIISLFDGSYMQPLRLSVEVTHSKFIMLIPWLFLII